MVLVNPIPEFPGYVVVNPVVAGLPSIPFWIILVTIPTQTLIAEWTFAHEPKSLLEPVSLSAWILKSLNWVTSDW